MIWRDTMLSLMAAVMAVEPALAQAMQAPGVAPSVTHVAYQPQDRDERGLWMQVDEAERQLKISPLVIRDPALNAYVRSVLCRTVGDERCGEVRLYITRAPHFNAAMAPNGMMQVWSGLLLRTQNEAQLAAVLSHEYAHFANRHSLRLFREAKSKSASAAWLAFTGIGLIASFGIWADLFRYSREMEHEADVAGLGWMARAGYDTREAASVWEQLRAEMDATAAARNVKSRKDKDTGLFASHPPSAERIAYLRQEAQAEPGVLGQTGADRYRAALGLLWPTFVDDQLKMNDFGASDYLLTSLAGNGWTPWLLYARGELYRRRAGGGDLDKANSYYSDAMAGGGELPELWRGRGLGRLKQGEVEAGRADLREYLRRAPQALDRSMIAMMAGGKE